MQTSSEISSRKVSEQNIVRISDFSTSTASCCHFMRLDLIAKHFIERREQIMELFIKQLLTSSLTIHLS
jgi:hypothetical protein